MRIFNFKSLCIFCVLCGYIFLCSCGNQQLQNGPDLTPTNLDDPNVITAKIKMHAQSLAEQTKQKTVELAHDAAIGKSNRLIPFLIGGIVIGGIAIGLKYYRIGIAVIIGYGAGFLAISTLAYAAKWMAAIGIGLISIVAAGAIYFLIIYRKAFIQIVLGNHDFLKECAATSKVSSISDFKYCQSAAQDLSTEKRVKKLVDKKKEKEDEASKQINQSAN